MMTYVALGMLVLSAIGLFISGRQQRQLFLMVLRHLSETHFTAIELVERMPEPDRGIAVEALQGLLLRQRREIEASRPWHPFRKHA